MSKMIRLYDRWLRIGVGEDALSFHYRWLRHQCDQDRHPKTGERIVDSVDIPSEIFATGAALNDDDQMIVTWSDGRQSRYSMQWLKQHAYCVGPMAVEPPPSDWSKIVVPLGANLAHLVLEMVNRCGVAVVQGFKRQQSVEPDDTEALIEEFSKAGLEIVGTHFGRIEDLRTDNTTNQNTDQLGYTNAGVNLHTDQPFLDQPPRYQLLHSMRTADSGGESFLVDAFQAVEYLRCIDAEAYQLLTTTPVRFHRKQKAFESIVDAPILQITNGQPTQVRYSYFTHAPFRVPFEKMEAWYRAYDRFVDLVRNPSHQYRFLLQPGDFVFYDNHRMLHARTAFQGPRWVRGVYFNPR
ncbi:MAG TPA: gamma-butyrobetaine dioxygenase [Planctomycetaceae bacterium]|nr:gamma-butyrobetaine dioxygenase [Planctomycetaceae bacterium]